MEQGGNRVRDALLAMALALTGCGGAPQAPEAPRKVLVVQPGAAADMAAEAFAGEVHARQESALSFRIGGNLTRRFVDAGQAVKQGQVLAELDPGDAQLQASAAQAEMARLGGDLERYRKLVAQKLVSQSAFDAQQAAYRAARAQYELARNQSAYTRLHAPRDGTIAELLVTPGAQIDAKDLLVVLG